MYLIFLIRVNCGAALNHSQKQTRNPSTVWRCCQAAFLASTACSANSMHIILTVWVGRWLLFAMLGIWICFECFAELDGVLSVARCVIVHHQCHTCTCIRCAHWFSSDSLSLQHILRGRSRQKHATMKRLGTNDRRAITKMLKRSRLKRLSRLAHQLSVQLSPIPPATLSCRTHTRKSKNLVWNVNDHFRFFGCSLAPLMSIPRAATSVATINFMAPDFNSPSA